MLDFWERGNVGVVGQLVKSWGEGDYTRVWGGGNLQGEDF